MAKSFSDGINEIFQEHACASFLVLGAIGVATVLEVPGLGVPLLAASGVAASGCIANQWRPKPPGFGSTSLGGQCVASYRVRVEGRWRRADGVEAVEVFGPRSVAGPLGPLRVVAVPLNPVGFSLQVTGSIRQGAGRVDEVYLSVNSGPGINSVEWLSYRFTVMDREDGLPDDCGAMPPIVYPFPPPGNPTPVPPRRPDGTYVIDARTYNQFYQFNDNSESVYIPITVGPVIVGPSMSFPLNFSLSIGDIRIGFALLRIDGSFDVSLDPPPSENPVSPADLEDIVERLKRIEACACKDPEPPDCPIDIISLPVGTSDGEGKCAIEQIVLRVEEGALSPAASQKFIDSAVLALAGCASQALPPQLDERLIYAASTLADGRELFSGTIGPEVVSLRIKVTSNSSGLNKITTFPGANQYKFGSVSFVTESVSGGGDYLYVFDSDTYYPLPRRGKDGKLRILFRSGLSFEVYDTGERIKV